MCGSSEKPPGNLEVRGFQAQGPALESGQPLVAAQAGR